MMTAIRACLESDVVIFDGSIEDDENRQYYAAIELMKHLDHVLVVSRTMLPFNFEGMRKGGAPLLITTSTAKYRYRKSNSEILVWLLDVLEHSSLELPRKVKPNLPEREYEKHMDVILQTETRLMEDARVRMSHRSGAFVSYLSKYSKEYKGTPTGLPYVETLFEMIAQTCQNPQKERFRAAPQPKQMTAAEILYFPPGNISLEFMTGQRRFEIVSVTESYIRSCKTFWIYQTEDYGSSWWTQGELLSLAKLFREDMNKCPNIYVVKPVRDAHGAWEFDVTGYLTPAEKASFLPELTDGQARELARLHSNSHPDTVAYEQIEKMRKLAKLPDVLLKVEHLAMVERFKQILPSMNVSTEEQKETLEELYNFDHYKESIRSFAYTREFWEARIVECPVCKAAADVKFSPEGFMHLKGSHFRTVSSHQYQTILRDLKRNPKNAVVSLPCGHKVSVCQSGVYYRWWTVKSDVPTGPCGKLIERIGFTAFNN